MGGILDGIPAEAPPPPQPEEIIALALLPEPAWLNEPAEPFF